MPTFFIDNQELTASDNTTILEAAQQAGIYIPYFCWHHELSIAANCRMCLVEIEGAPKLLPACQTPVKDDMQVKTNSPAVKESQRATMEFLLLNHPIDCPICDQAGECKLQDYYMEYDGGSARIKASEKRLKPRLEKFSDKITYNAERCIMCTRCVRFMSEIAKDPILSESKRSNKAEIVVAKGRTFDNPYSLNIVDICPVGALTSNQFRFRQRAWYLQHGLGICTGCSKGCNIRIDHRSGNIYRYIPSYHPHINKSWMCDEGRTTYQRYNNNRLETPLLENQVTNVSNAYDTIVEKIGGFTDSEKLAFSLSSHLSCEDLIAATKLLEQFPKAKVYQTGLPPGNNDDFLMKADKNPNAKGAQLLLKHHQVHDQSTLWNSIQRDDIHALVMVGTEVDNSSERSKEIKKSNLELLITLSIRQDPISSIAHIALPACAPTETACTFVNADGYMQRTQAIIHPKKKAVPYAYHLLRILGQLQDQQPPTYHPKQLWSEIVSLLPSDLQNTEYDALSYPSTIIVDNEG